MIKFDKFTLDNGLRVIVHKDVSTPIVAMNLLYDVGAKDEAPSKTGFAHLFEHLMFGGSINIPSFDEALQKAGGNNNAFTTNDITNYYITLPKENIETAFWLESDRMLSLAFSEKSLEVQRNVVIEEFKQRYLNQPYGDVWLLLRPLAYKTHPYKWATIGKELDHIANATMEDVKSFFYAHYAPNNAILTITGNIETDQVKKLADKWFAPIEKRKLQTRNLPEEPIQTKEKKLVVERDVPVNAIYKVFHMCSRTDKNYYATDLLSDILSTGKSSRFHQNLIKNKKYFSEISAYIMGSIDKGLFVIDGLISENIDIKKAENEIHTELSKIIDISDYELQKVKNKVEANLVFTSMSPLNKAMSLAYHELLGNAENINMEAEKYANVSLSDIKEIATSLFRKENCSTLYYNAK